MRNALAAVLTAVFLGAGVRADPLTAERLRDITPGWEVDPRPLLSGFLNLYNPCVLRVLDEEWPFRMWLFGWASEEGNPGYPGYDAIFCARSRDLAQWEVWSGDAGWDATMTPAKWVPVLCAGEEPFDNFHAGDPSVVFHEGRYYMAFSSVGVAHAEDDPDPARLTLTSCVMGAVSEDGVRWTKSERPIAIWARESIDRWYLVDGKVGDPPPGYMGSYHRPALLREGNRWRLWFDYYLPGTFVSMGYAECDGDFLRAEDWRIEAFDEAPLLRDWPNACVVRAGEWLYSVSDAPNYPPEIGGEGRMLTLARSRDGRSWEVLGHLRPEPGACSHVPEALVLDGWLYVLYSWKPIVTPWDYRYKEIRAMRHRLAENGSLTR